MKSLKNIYYTVCLTGLLSVSTSSCTDWLTIYPQDRVVEENFWEDKNDLEGVRNGAYRQMANTVSKLVLWGELRSDNFKENTAFQGNNRDEHNMYMEIQSGMPDSSMSVFDWGGVYTTINYCNKVLQHGEEVLAKDKQFTTSEWLYMKAEMTALRALNYFYLIRAFKDVPYTTKVINKDAEVEHFPLTNQLVVLDSIIADCESVAGRARQRFSDVADSKGMITNSAIYAMLADMYLWRGSLHEGRHGKKGNDFVNGQEVPHDVTEDYQKAVDYAEMSLLSLARQNRDERGNIGLVTTSDEYFDYGLSKISNPAYTEAGLSNYNMIKNTFIQTSVPRLEAQTAIFTIGNSAESIFELQYRISDNLKNTIVNSLFGSASDTHLQANKESLDLLFNGGTTGETDTDGGKWDSRVWTCCQSQLTTGNLISSGGSGSGSNGTYCVKYQLPTNNILNMESSGNTREIKSVRYLSDEEHNWIIYRMTDVMLIQAEAYACMAKNTSGKEYKNAMAICNAIHRRSFYNYSSSASGSFVPGQDATATTASAGNTYTGSTRDTQNGLKNINASIIAVMNERQIELIGEGKRWFDLVRFAERCSAGPKSDGKPGDPEDPRESTEEWPVQNGYTGMLTMVDMFLSAGGNSNFATTLKNRFKNRYGLYNPIYYMEVKASEGAIEQNPVWNKSKYEQ